MRAMLLHPDILGVGAHDKLPSQRREQELPVPICWLSRRLGRRKAWSALPPRILAMALLCPPALALNPDWQIYQYGHRTWKSGDTFPSGAVNAITQDADGYFWVGTYNG